MPKKKLYEKYEQMKELMGAEMLLEEIIQGMSSDEMRDSLKFIARMHDLSEDLGEVDSEK